jgi:hypothetical protein
MNQLFKQMMTSVKWLSEKEERSEA